MSGFKRSISWTSLLLLAALVATEGQNETIISSATPPITTAIPTEKALEFTAAISSRVTDTSTIETSTVSAKVASETTKETILESYPTTKDSNISGVNSEINASASPTIQRTTEKSVSTQSSATSTESSSTSRSAATRLILSTEATGERTATVEPANATLAEVQIATETSPPKSTLDYETTPITGAISNETTQEIQENKTSTTEENIVDQSARSNLTTNSSIEEESESTLNSTVVESLISENDETTVKKEENRTTTTVISEESKSQVSNSSIKEKSNVPDKLDSRETENVDETKNNQSRNGNASGDLTTSPSSSTVATPRSNDKPNEVQVKINVSENETSSSENVTIKDIINSTTENGEIDDTNRISVSTNVPGENNLTDNATQIIITSKIVTDDTIPNTTTEMTTEKSTTKIPVADMLMNDQPKIVISKEVTEAVETATKSAESKDVSVKKSPTETHEPSSTSNSKTTGVDEVTVKPKGTTSTTPKPKKKKKKSKNPKPIETSTDGIFETTDFDTTENPTTIRETQEFESKFIPRDTDQTFTTDEGETSSTESMPDTTIPWDHYGMPFGYGPWMDGTFGNPLWSEEDPFVGGPDTHGKELIINGEIKIVQGEEWSPEFERSETLGYGVLAAKVKQELKHLYAKTTISKVLNRIEITGFKSKDGIVVTYNLLLQTASDLISRHYLKKVFNKHLKDRKKLGPYTLDPEATSFDLEHHKALNFSDSSDDEPAIPQWAIAFIVVAAACLIFSLMFAAVTVYGRSHGAQNNGTLYDREGMVESCPGWERKLAAAYENIAADSVYDNEDGIHSDPIRKDSQRRVERRDSGREARSLGCPEERYQVSDRII